MRTVEEKGIALVSHLHDSSAGHIAPWSPLSSDGYGRLFGRMETLFYDEEELFRIAMMGVAINFGCHIPVRHISDIREMIMVVGSENLMSGNKLYGTGPVTQYRGRLSLNPLFKFEKDKEALRLCLRFPSKSYRSEYEILVDQLPRKLEISLEEWNSLKDQLENDDTTGEIENYMNKGILVASPELYFGPTRPSMDILPLSSQGVMKSNIGPETSNSRDTKRLDNLENGNSKKRD